MFVSIFNSHASVYNDGDFGAGLILFEPTGASLKYFFNEKWAVDGLQIHSDLLYHFTDGIPLDGLSVFIGGIGGRWYF